VLEVLTSFVREHSPDAYDEQRRQGKPPDVQAAALTVVGRRNTEHDRRRVNLSRANLPRADLAYANLVGADLADADLTRADLTRANLTGADLTGADLTRANLLGANLLGTYLTRANLAGANLTSADLTSADLTSADLTGALWPRVAAIPSGWVAEGDPADDTVVLKRADASSPPYAGDTSRNEDGDSCP
jgi:hypothetical protein